MYLIDDTDDNSKIRVSVNDSVITSDFEKGGNIEIPFDRKDTSISIGFLQDISFTKIFIYYVYKEIEAPNTIIQNIYNKSRYYLIWNFSGDRCCLPINSENNVITKTLSMDADKGGFKGKYTLEIDTSMKSVNDVITKPVSWYNSVIDTIEQLCGITDYIVEYSDSTIPYDLDFSAGTSAYEILRELVDLKVNWEMFFDINGVLRIQSIPNLYEDTVVLNSDIITPLVISESNNDSFSNVRNITEIWGMSIDVSYYTENCETISNGYKAVFSDLVFTDEKNISNNTIFAIKVDDTNIKQPYITVAANYIDADTQTKKETSLEPIPICTSSGNDIEANLFKKDISYCFKYYKGKFYYLGQFQVHGMCIETEKNPTNDEKELNREKYNCENIYYSVEPNSPYYIEKIGKRIQVLSGDDYENIYSDELAVERAKLENWKKTRRQETITLQMIDIPWIDVNCKIEYKSYVNGETHQYIIKNISSVTSDGTMTVELMRFYPLYILDAKCYDSVIELKEYMNKLKSTYKYNIQGVNNLDKLLEDGTKEIYDAENTEDIKTILTSYKNKMDSVEKIKF